MTMVFGDVPHQHRRDGKETEVRKCIYAGDFIGPEGGSASVYDRSKAVYRRRRLRR
jgi:hypothetical protein